MKTADLFAVTTDMLVPAVVPVVAHYKMERVGEWSNGSGRLTSKRHVCHPNRRGRRSRLILASGREKRLSVFPGLPFQILPSDLCSALCTVFMRWASWASVRKADRKENPTDEIASRV